MKLDFKEDRDNDFLESYVSVIKRYNGEAPYQKRDTLLSETILSPAKRFYVSEEQALRIVSRMLRGHVVTFKNSLKKLMYEEILNRVKKELRNGEKSLTLIISKVINQEAPRFYIDLKSARILYYKLLNR